MTDTTESVVRFGTGEHLLGILTSARQPAPNAPVCLLLNTGVWHRVGPHRLNVKLARALAARGFTTLRMDLSGLGDSQAPSELATLNSSDQAIADLRAAMDFVESSQGVSSFVLFGLCSGAQHGYRLAQVDPRIVALMMFDGYAFPTIKTHVLRRIKRFRASPWLAVRRKLIELATWYGSARRARAMSAAESEHPTARQFRVAMDALVSRGTSVRAMHSGSVVDAFNYADQWRDKFGGAPFMRHFGQDYMPELDHMLCTIAAQRKLIEIVGEWVQGSFGASTGSAASSR